jgi:hypothetical protein
MSPSDNYRARAIECIEAADATDSFERKTVLLELAQRWLDLASRMDARGLRSNVLLYQPRQTRH